MICLLFDCLLLICMLWVRWPYHGWCVIRTTVVRKTYHPLSGVFHIALESETVDRGRVLSPVINAFGADDDPELFQGLQCRAQGRAVAHATALIQHPAVAGGDAAQELVERNRVVVFLEAQRPPDDVEQGLDLGLAQDRQEAVEYHVRDRRGGRVLKPLEIELVVVS